MKSVQARMKSAKADKSSVEELTTTISTKADQSSLESLSTTINSKANQSSLEELTTTVESKADKTTVEDLTTTVTNLTTTVNNKADQASVDNLSTTLESKANKTSVEELTTTVNSKADETRVDGLLEVLLNDKTKIENLRTDVEDLRQTVGSKADQTSLTELSSLVDTKANQSSLDELSTLVNSKADKTTLESLNTTVESKADQTSLTELSTLINSKADQTSLTELSALIDTKADKTSLTTLETNVTGRLTTLENNSGKCLDEQLTVTPLQGASQELLDKINEVSPEANRTDTIEARTAIIAAYENAALVRSENELIIKPKITALRTDVDAKASQADLEALTTTVDTKASQTIVNNLTTKVDNKADKSKVELIEESITNIPSEKQLNRMLQIFPTPTVEYYGYYDSENNDFVYATKNDDLVNLKNAEILCITGVRSYGGLWSKYCDELSNLTDEETPALKKIVFAGDDFVMNDIIYYRAATIPKYLANLTEIHVNIRLGKTGVMSSDIGNFYDMLYLRTAMEAQTQGYQKIKVFIHKYAGALNMSVQDMYFSNLTDLFYLQGVDTIEEITSETTSQYHGVEWSYEVVNH